MTPLKPTTYRLDEDLLESLQAIKDRDGIPITEQVRRALRVWVESKAIDTKTDRQRAATRKRS